jgi:hypothetical protein
MTDHELLRNQATGIANRPPQWLRRDALAQAQQPKLIRPDQPLQWQGPYGTPNQFDPDQA